MQFEEKKALEIQQQHNLPDSVIRVWKTRGKIPKRYFSEDFKPREPLTKEQQVQQASLVKAMCSEKMNTQAVGRICNINPGKIIDAHRKGVDLSRDEFIALQKYRVQFKKDISEVIAKCSTSRFSDFQDKILKKFLVRPDIKIATLLNDLSKEDHSRIRSWLSGKQQSIPDLLKRDVVSALEVLKLEL